jgi:hypothetical protein
VWILTIAMIFSAIFAYARLMTIVSKAREDTQRVLDSFVIESGEEIYQSIKNGNHDSIGRTYSVRFAQRIRDELALEEYASALYSRTEGLAVTFQYSDSLTTHLNGEVLELKSDFKIIVPLWFSGVKVTDLAVPMRVKSLYVLKF